MCAITKFILFLYIFVCFVFIIFDCQFLFFYMIKATKKTFPQKKWWYANTHHQHCGAVVTHLRSAISDCPNADFLCCFVKTVLYSCAKNTVFEDDILYFSRACQFRVPRSHLRNCRTDNPGLLAVSFLRFSVFFFWCEQEFHFKTNKFSILQ
jgi:hypothetical protein